MAIPGDSSAIDQALRIGQLIVFAIGIGAVLWKLSGLATKLQMTAQFQDERLEVQGKRIDRVDITLSELTKIMTTQASEKVRLDALGILVAEIRQDINLLRIGKGFIQGEIDGEYPRKR